MKTHHLFLAVALLSSSPAWSGAAIPSGLPVGNGVLQQTKKITGTVTDPSGEPIIGANVVVKGTTHGTITDLDGKFSFDVPENSVLEISYIGYLTQSVPLNGQNTLAVSLKEDSQNLDEVVVVGYGVQKKSDVTGSVTSISKERLGKIPVANVLQAVQGAAAGITITQSSAAPGDEPSALVRGKNSINAGTGPYIVVDGVPISKAGGTLNDINPNDIESMEILKDASATAIYGTNGANGVILITTKRGKVGKPTVRYNGYVGFDQIAHKLDLRSGEELIQIYKDYAAQNPGDAAMFNENVKYENEADNFAAGRTTNWIDEVSQTGLVQGHNLSISGGAENVKYYISGDYMNQEGVLKGYQYKRYSFRTNLDANVTDYLTIGTSSYINAHNRDGGRASLLGAAAMSPYGKLQEEDGSYCIYPMASEKLFVNPMLNTTAPAERRRFNINMNGYAEVNFGKIWNPLEGLKYKLNAGYSFVPERNSTYKGRSVNDQSGTAEIHNYDTQNYTIENIVSYARDFGKHHLDLTGLYSAQRKKYRENMAKAVGFVNDELIWNNLAAGANSEVSSKAEKYAALSLMGRVNYSYDSRYLFTFTVRRDGSSVFGSANSKYGTFPSVALGWNIANEHFMEQNNDWLNNLKLRLSYGKAGNEAINVYQSISTMANHAIAMGGLSNISLVADVLGNANLTWETTQTFNGGLDFGLWDNRLSGNLDVYFAETSDLLMKRNLPKITGFDYMYANMGKTANKGVELTLNSRNIVTRDFQWNTGLVFSWNKNEIKDLYGDRKDDLGNRWFIGHPIDVIYDYEMIGIWQEDEIGTPEQLANDPVAKAGDPKFANLDGKPGVTDGDRKVLGQKTPKWIGGLTNTFTYKNLSLSVFVQTVQGMLLNNTEINIASDEFGRRNTAAEVGYWTPENKSNEWRSLNKNSNPHGYGFPCKANYTRIKDITLSYNFPEVVAQKLHIGALSVYLSGRNLYTFTNWIGWDPESRQIPRGNSTKDYYSNSNSTFYDDSNYPSVRSFVFGINLTL